MAASLNQGKSIEFLVERGAKLNRKNSENLTAKKISILTKNKIARKSISRCEKKASGQVDFAVRFRDWLEENRFELEKDSFRRIREIAAEQKRKNFSERELDEFLLRNEINSKSFRRPNKVFREKKPKKLPFVPIPIGENFRATFVPIRRFQTDSNRFCRDRMPENAIVDDSSFYLDDEPDEFIEIHDAGFL